MVCCFTMYFFNTGIEQRRLRLPVFALYCNDYNVGILCGRALMLPTFVSGWAHAIPSDPLCGPNFSENLAGSNVL